MIGDEVSFETTNEQYQLIGNTSVSDPDADPGIFAESRSRSRLLLEPDPIRIRTGIRIHSKIFE
jgi:hypothetical protein